MPLHANQWLLDKINAFIAKYYRNKLLKGFLIVSGCILLYLLMLILGEYFFYFPPVFKIIAIALPSLVALYAITRYIAIPLFQMMRMGKRISESEAASIIGSHFPEIGDRLVNVLQLQSRQVSGSSRELIEASIEQKSRQLAPFQFTQAIQLSQNKKWLPLVLLPVFLCAAIYFFNPGIWTQSGTRLINVTTQYTKPAPFDFRLLTTDLTVAQYEDLSLKVELKGDAIPNQLTLIIEGEQIVMTPEGKHVFSYTVKKIDQKKDFQLEAAGYLSRAYSITVIHKPGLDESKITLKYPAYTSRENEEIYGLADLTVPHGTELIYTIKTNNTSDATLIRDNEPMKLTPAADNEFGVSIRAAEDFEYTLRLENKDMPFVDPNLYRVQVVKDQPPQINAKEFKEKISGEQVVLTGNASDDYGLSKAAFVYQIIGTNGKTRKSASVPLQLTGKATTTLQQYFDFATLALSPGEKVNYYMEVWDNDAVSGSKSARSQVFEFKTVGYEETQKALQENNEELNKSLASGKEKMQELDEQLKKMQESTVQDKELTAWEQKQNMDILQDQQETLKERLEEIQKRMEVQKELIEKKEYNEQIREKQESTEKQIDNLLNKELSEQMKKLQELLQEKNADMKMQDFQKMQDQNALFQMDLERIEEMIRQIEAQIMMEEVANKLEQLSERQDQLNKKTSDNTRNNDQLRKEQDQLRQELDQLLSKEFSEMKEKASDQNFDDEQQAGEEAGDEMQESGDQLQENQNQKSKQSQQNASDQLQKMAASLKNKSAGMDMEMIDINIKATRQLLTNLLRLSFDQEALMEESRNVSTTSELYKDLVRKQYQLKKSSALIKDSLFSLSKRVVELGPTINKESMELERRLDESVKYMENRQLSVAGVNQQYAMTSSNNLALILNELLSNLLMQQAQMNASGQGEGEGKGQGQSQGQSKGKSGEGGGDGAGDKMKDIITGQQQMGKGLNQLRQEMGGNPGGQQQGQGQGSGQGEGQGQGQQDGSGQQSSSGNEGNNTAEILSRLAYEQAKLRQQVQELNSIMNSKGIKGNAQLMREIQEQMDRLETDLINRKISDDLVERQNNILTRLLKAEEAIREQEQDNQRQGETGMDQPRAIPPELQKHIDELQHIKEIYRTTPPELKPYYKKISDKYLERINS